MTAIETGAEARIGIVEAKSPVAKKVSVDNIPADNVLEREYLRQKGLTEVELDRVLGPAPTSAEPTRKSE